MTWLPLHQGDTTCLRERESKFGQQAWKCRRCLPKGSWNSFRLPSCSISPWLGDPLVFSFPKYFPKVWGLSQVSGMNHLERNAFKNKHFYRKDGSESEASVCHNPSPTLRFSQVTVWEAYQERRHLITWCRGLWGPIYHAQRVFRVESPKKSLQ